MYRRGLAALALLLGGTAHAEWYEVSSKHFVVYADDKPDRIKAYTTKLERYDRAMKVMRGVPEDRRGPASRVTVYQLDDIDQVQKLANMGNIGGFYSSRASGSVAFVPRNSGGNGAPWALKSERILLHEYAHHFMYADWPSAIFPRWFSEGFAEYNSTAIFNADGSVTFGAPPTDRAWGVAEMNVMPLSEMLNPALGKIDDRATYVLYSRGWALTHYLTQDAERRKMLADYLGAINDGRPAAEAMAAFGNVNALDFKLLSYVKSPTFASQVVPADKIQVGNISVRKLGAGEAATMPARIRSQAGVTPSAAKQVVVAARAQAAGYPNDAAAQNELAEAEYDAKNFEAAAAAADRALAADPKSVHALLYKGMALQDLAEKTKSTDNAQWQAVRRWYVAANKVDPEDPWPLILFYRSFKPSGQAPSKSAEAGLLYASALAPFDLGVRMEAARVYLQQGKIPEAKRAMMLVAYNPHGGDTANKLREVMTALYKDGAGPALTKLDALDKEREEKAKTGAKDDG